MAYVAGFENMRGYGATVLPPLPGLPFMYIQRGIESESSVLQS